MSKVYFITGANRGIGLALTQALASDSRNIVLASARDPSKATELNALAAKGNVHIIKLDVSSQDSIDQLGPQLETYASDGIDYFISNAGISTGGSQTSMKVPREVWFRLLTTNTVGPVMLTRVVYPYLAKKDTKIIYFVSSVLGSIGGFIPFPSSAYGLSKAALNFYTKLLSHELSSEGFTVVAAHPGAVSTDMGNAGTSLITDPAVLEMVKKITITPADSVSQQLAVIAKLTKEDNGKFFSFTGDEIPW